MKKTIAVLLLITTISFLPAVKANAEPLLDYEGGWNFYLREPENSITHFAIGAGSEYLVYKCLEWMDLNDSMSTKNKLIISMVGVSFLALMGETIIYPDEYSTYKGNPDGRRNIRDLGLDFAGMAIGAAIAVKF